ncbi:MAG: inositol monophosphatase family protein [Pigmentiphaga sp.]|uniref:inositol monophosphatase family protein n=1 Tax=Pigmentiphaga sp. TaxID=1977564 RepID=UPI0029BEC842|nr:inositol monophosphatase family protein [Pigmentiphaga sp.]MDX3907712.1 inositol monophosphatase family protein [Pigmentiphaga sp.]
MHPMLNTAVKAARRAGAIINRASLDLDLVKVSQKGPGDFVTEVDKAAEAAIVDILKTAYPDHGILAEESGETPGAADANGRQENLWIIDPLDGTTNFIHGMPIYAVSIALMQRGQVTQACIFDPSRNELFTATRGAGAFLNDRRIRVSRRTRIPDTLIGTSFAPDTSGKRLALWTKTFGQISATTSGLRRQGSSVLELANVAAGRLDGYYGCGLKPWDLAAASLLVLEAGGLIGDFDGEQGWMESGEIVAATPKIFPQLLGLLEPLKQARG